jgi:hypothetical protein
MLSKLKDTPLSNFDIMSKLNNKCNIVLYPDIHNYRTVDELFGGFDGCVILFESQPKYGHWVCITKHGNSVEFFNSYGGYPDDSLKKIDKQFAKESKQDYPYLTKLLLNSRYDLFYNEFPFQKKCSKIKTCGRHCIVRILEKHLDIYDYKDKLDKLCQEYDCDYDDIVTILTT